MSRRFVFIVNPISGRVNKGLVQQKIESFARRSGISYTLFPSSRDGDYGSIEQFIREHRISDVVIAGGDGTINSVIGALHPTGVQFSLLPCGSGNGLAGSAGLNKTLDAALDTLLLGHPVWVDALTVNGRFACMLCGLGFDAQVAHDFANDPRRGLATYIRKVVRHFFRAPTYSFCLHFNDIRLDLEAYFISVANSNQYGNNFTIAPRANLTDGLLDVVVAVRQPRARLLLQTLRQVLGANRLQDAAALDRNKGVVYFQTDRLRIENGEAAPLHIDGDPAMTASELDVQVIKGCYQLLLP